MPLKPFMALILGVAFGLASAGNTAFAEPEKSVLRISGSSTLLPIAQKAAEYYMGLHPEINISVSGSGSGDGLKGLIEGAADIAMSSRDLHSREKKRLSDANINLNRHTVAVDCVAAIVNPANPIDHLTLEELQGVYDGRLKTWKELGWADKKIIAINRDVSSGTFETWLEMVLEGKKFRRDAQMQTSSGGVMLAVAGNKYAVGYVGLAYLNPSVKVVSINGITPNLETVARHEYPLTRDLYMFTAKNTSPLASEFISFLTGPDGRKLVEREGFAVPFKGEP